MLSLAALLCAQGAEAQVDSSGGELDSRVLPSEARPALPPPVRPPPCPKYRLRLAPVVALLAGPLVHGAGAFTACQRQTGKRLLIAEGAGFGALLAGGAGLALSGASRRLVAPFAFLSILGVGAFVTSWVADVYGAFNRGRSHGRPSANASWEAALGYRYVHDPQFEYRSFANVAVRLWFGLQRLFVEAWVALDDATQTARLGYARRLYGGTGRGTSLETRLALGIQRFHNDGFATFAAELALAGRLDLASLGPSLGGSFVEGEIGLGFETLGYDATSRALFEDFNGLLLGRVGYGVYLGPLSEVLVAYDHRRDGLEGGLSVDSIAAGVLGHLELVGRGFFARAPRWGLEGMVAVGSAWIVGASLVFRAALPEESMR